ncbi:MAG: hypothetical protein KKI02_01500, partial [Planctomycetes bacterium]|nr:hypothetical protein [Planctomycetota bacterium]
MSIERLIAYERLTTPSEHLGILIEPPADTIATLVTADQTRVLRSARLLDASVAELRQQLRQRLELAAPVILTGHQVEFVHTGVFAKTIAVDALTARFGAGGAYVAVDSDLPKTTRLSVPCAEEGEVRQTPVSIPGCDPQLPAEWQPFLPVAQWRSFFNHIKELAGENGSLLRSYAEGAGAGPDDIVNVSGVIERGHAAVNRAIGLADPRRLLTSRLSRTPEFRAFLAHLMLNASSFARCYNEAQQAYRARRRVRNPRRPVPLLSTDGDRVELPLWISRSGQQRRRLAVARHGDRIALFAGGQSLGSETTSRLRSATSHAEPWQIEHDGWHLRPRALTLSAFIRLFLSDLFVHGIGGAKYDEMTEDFILRFFGVDLPPTCCVSATAYLP